jgi:hypothetical protein
MAKLYSASGEAIVFYIHAPNGLLNKVWFEVMYFDPVQKRAGKFENNDERNI